MSLLIFTKTNAYRHEAFEQGTQVLLALASELGLSATATEDARAFEPANIARYRATIWLSTSGNVLDASERAGFEAFIRGGGGYLGIHGASAAETDWPFYRQLVGARFTFHPESQPARLLVEDRDHPATSHLGREWLWNDEWYEFDANPRPHVRVLVSVDEGSYRGGRMGDHPLVWCQELGASRSFYTALGHAAEHFDDGRFRRHLLGAMRWVLRMGANQPSLSAL